MAAGAVLGLQPVAAQEAAPAVTPASQWITLGTHGGPVPHPDRAEPANLLLTSNEVYLVDVGDGAANQMARAGVPLARLSGVFISHLHFDHTGGLGAVLGLRFQTEAQNTLTIYGPPGTRQLVDGLIASMRPGGEAGYGVPGEAVHDPAAGIAVVEWRGGETAVVGGMTVRNVENTHYSFTADSPQYGRYASLSFRFDLPDRSILYTGDTAPSAAVDQLGQGADLLVAEMIDLDGLLSAMGPTRGDSPGGPPSILLEHLRTHHITPAQIGEMAAFMEVGEVVVTHLVIGNAGREAWRRYEAEIGEHYDGVVTIAQDLDGF
ncbi:MBL fold metallo-hydrolase [Altererythrobacter aestuarii]|uniref:MBL fold metallo-hydrolase n=2 Tax=Alteraurantiacibacter aestuarii TaxID=650004 RepID=A0A844ZJN9_9SPHN|nr:MBL fold metallo-hydrolase [Alteraurantiacibacter aestuarii]